MPTEPIRFDDGKAYEHFMGKWSQLVGHLFLEWLAPKPNLRWLDVGCGNGAFTEMVVERCAPSLIHGVDPSEGQLSYARRRAATKAAHYQIGDAMALPFPAASFDVAVMPLVIFFVPDPARGVAEMVRVVDQGGIVAAYAWDMPGGGFPYASLRKTMEELGVEVSLPPSPDASRLDALHDYWKTAGLHDIETREITVHRKFTNFDDYWTAILGGPSVRASFSKLDDGKLPQLKERMREQLTSDANGRITYSARANAVKGRRP